MMKLSKINIIYHLNAGTIPKGGPYLTSPSLPQEQQCTLLLNLLFSQLLFIQKSRAGNGTSQMITINLITFMTCCECN